MNAEAILKQIGIEKTAYNDLHVTRMFSAFVVVSDGKVIHVTDPSMTHCPLARLFYHEYMDTAAPVGNIEKIKAQITRAMEDKIARVGLFTERRELVRNRIEVPYGASEMMMYALRKKFVDAAVVVCDGAGTVIVDRPEVVQGIGARMNGLFYTTPIPGIIAQLEALCATVVFRDASINQIEGVREAARRGYRSIAVTISSFTDERVSDLKAIERQRGVQTISLMVCATGVGETRLREIERDADLVWSCGSHELRSIIGKRAILQITTKIPVYVLTEKGLVFAAAYSSNEALIRGLDRRRQYIIAGYSRGNSSRGYRKVAKLTMGTFQTYLSEAELPVRDQDEPAFRG